MTARAVSSLKLTEVKLEVCQLIICIKHAIRLDDIKTYFIDVFNTVQEVFARNHAGTIELAFYHDF